MKNAVPDRRSIVKELEERLKKKWAAEKKDDAEAAAKLSNNHTQKKPLEGLRVKGQPKPIH